jgi:hypothetical protein
VLQTGLVLRDPGQTRDILDGHWSGEAERHVAQGVQCTEDPTN